MTWVKVDDLFPENVKIVPLSDAAFRVHVTGICYASRNLTDGFIPTNKAKEIAAGRARVLGELVPHLWEPAEGGYRIHDYLVYNAPRDSVLTKRGKAKERMDTVRSQNVRANKPRNSLNPIPNPIPNPRSNERSTQDNDDPIALEARDPVGAVVASFARFGKLTAGTAQAIEESCDRFSVDWARRAVQIAAGGGFDGQPPWAYVYTILERWKRQGKPDDEMETDNGRASKPLQVNGSRGRPRSNGTAVSDGSDWAKYAAGED